MSRKIASNRNGDAAVPYSTRRHCASGQYGSLLSGLWSGETVITSRTAANAWNGFWAIWLGVVEVLDGTRSTGLAAPKITGVQASKRRVLKGSFWYADRLQPERAGASGFDLFRRGCSGEVDLVLWQGYASLPVASQPI